MATLNSMTAFARRRSQAEWGTLTCECRTVNHRYLDPSLRLPESLRHREMAYRERLGQRLSRGRVELQFRLEGVDQAAGEDPDPAVLRRLRQAMVRVEQEIGDTAPVSPLEVLQWPGVLAGGELPEEAIAAAADELLELTLDDVAEQRRREGERLLPLLQERLATIEGHVAGLRRSIPEWRGQQRQRLVERLAEAGAEPADERLAQELAILAQKADVSEELDRLDAHVSEVRAALEQSGPVGRRLDFLMQELNREANTLSSKSTAAELTRVAVEIKVLIEQMREQVQNVE
ncbi:YicC/YloC family endoribonuclease [Vreelandella utahensis]|uniref:YicC/YloC family endoribonuclease n=1 Tax=Vreelandella halophila TaxID=86177 RepID=UPI001FE35B21|nr:YicC/YloC family endoribonuclease [Halomonas utahensis]